MSNELGEAVQNLLGLEGQRVSKITLTFDIYGTTALVEMFADDIDQDKLQTMLEPYKWRNLEAERDLDMECRNAQDD